MTELREQEETRKVGCLSSRTDQANEIFVVIQLCPY
jgi:hypothetical protein